MALLLLGGLLGGMAGEAGGVDRSGEGAWTLASPPEGFLAASETGEPAHLLHPNACTCNNRKMYWRTCMPTLRQITAKRTTALRTRPEKTIENDALSDL